MKTIEVKITASFDVPDDWEVIEHVPDASYPDDKLKVIKIGNEVYDFFPECLKKVEEPDRIYWSADEGKTEDIIDCMNNFNVKIFGKK